MMRGINIKNISDPLLVVRKNILVISGPAQVMSCFLFVASRDDGCTTAESQAELGLTAASMSRCTTWLTGQHRSNPARGLNLITKEVY